MKLPSENLIKPGERAIIGVGWKPNPSMSAKAFREAFESSESVLQASCDGEEQLCIPLELIPTHGGWEYYFQAEQPNSWGYFDLLANPLPLERTRFDHPAWAIMELSLNDMHDGHCWRSGKGCAAWDSSNCSCDCVKCVRTMRHSQNGQSETDWWHWAYSQLTYKAPEQLESSARQLAVTYGGGMEQERVVSRLLDKDAE